MAVKLAVELAVWLLGLLGLLGLPGLPGLILWLVRYCKKRRMQSRSASPSTPLGSRMLNFTLDEVQVCTDDFSHENLLGEGGFGLVYRGVLDEKAVAVKRLKAWSRQGEREFENEIDITSRVHHKNVVSLVGYCKTESECILVYELVPNKTVEFHLHGEGQPTLDWRTRMKIALGSAKGLAYLHEDCHPEIIHCDIKAANILVDNEFEAKIADFGLAKYTSDANSHESTDVKGTSGYLAPEYISSGNLTEKSDVFSFGVVLLELITGCRAVVSTHNSMDNWLVNRARPQLTRALKDRNFGLLVDPKLQTDYRENEMTRMVGCAAACVHLLAEQRPTMSKIVRALEGDLPLSNLNDGITIFHGSSDCGASHYSDPASERGLYPSGSSSMGPCRQTNWDLEMGRMEKDSQGFSGGS